MESDSKKIDFGEIESPEKLENGNMRSDLDTIKSNYDKEERVEDKNKIVDSSPILAPLPENSGQATARLLGPLKLLSDSWQLYKSRWKTFLGIVIVPILLILFVLLIFGVGALCVGFLGIYNIGSLPANIITFFISFILLLALFLTIIIIQFWSQAALFYAIKDSAENIGIKESYRRGWHKIRSFFWVSILSSFIIMGGYMFFFIPGIIFAIWFSLALYIVIAEDLNGMDALLKSREYIRNYWWSVLWRFFVMGLFIYLIIIIFGIFIFLIAMLLGITVDLNSDSFETIINLPINIISLIFAPLMVIYPFLIYNNLKEIKGDFEFKPSKKSKRFFIIIGLLGFLIIPFLLFSSIVLVSLNSARHKAMDATRYSDIQQLQLKLLIYSDEERIYPKSLDELDGAEYFIDPETENPYEYRQLDNGDDYEICVQFEEENRKCFSSKDDAYENPHKDSYNDDINKETLNDGITERDAQRMSDILSISLMLNNYKIENGEYPLSQISAKLNGGNFIVSKIRSANEKVNLPLDPKHPTYYYGYKSLDGESFELTAQLENIDDPRCDAEIKKSSEICIYKFRK